MIRTGLGRLRDRDAVDGAHGSEVVRGQFRAEREAQGTNAARGLSLDAAHGLARAGGTAAM